MTILLICGAPRSSTTWMHNVLIETGHFSGRFAIDTEFMDYSDDRVLFTDEDRRLTYYGMHAKHSYIAPYFRYKFVERIGRFKSTYGCNGNLLLESPYYSFIIDLFHDVMGDELRVVHMRRRLEDVAVSMTTHPHIKIQLNRQFNKSCDFMANFITPIEVQYARKTVVDFVRYNYSHLSAVDRAAFKRHCFINAFQSPSRSTNVKIFDFNVSNPSDEDFFKLGRFCDLSDSAMQEVKVKYRSNPRKYPDINEQLAELLRPDDLDLPIN